MSLELTPDLAATCADLGTANEEFLRFVARTPGCLDRASFSGFEEKTPLKLWALHPWPLFLNPDKHRQLEEATLGVLELIRAVPRRFLGGDPQRVAEFYGFDQPWLVPLLLEEPNGIASGLARGDFIDSTEGFKCLEFNISGNLGGFESQLWASFYLEHPLLRDFFAEYRPRPRFVDTSRLLMEHVVSEARSRLDLREGSLGLGFLVQEEVPAVVRQEMERWAEPILSAVLDERAPGLDGRVVVGDRSSIEVDHERTELAGTPISSVIELTPETTPPALYRQFKARRVLLYNGPLGGLLSSKANLALLSELAEEGGGELTDREREVVHRHIPWTRWVRPGRTTFRGETIDLEATLLGLPEQLVLKKVDSTRGDEVVPGFAVSPEQWRRQVADSLAAGNWIVQERVVSRPYPGQRGESGYGPYDVVWGLLVFGSIYAGGFLRLEEQGGEAVINAARGAEVSLWFEA